TASAESSRHRARITPMLDRSPSPADVARASARRGAAAAADAATVTSGTPVVSLPRETQSSVFFLDESGSKGSGGEFFVVGGIKTRKPGHIAREVRAVRD